MEKDFDCEYNIVNCFSNLFTLYTEFEREIPKYVQCTCMYIKKGSFQYLMSMECFVMVDCIICTSFVGLTYVHHTERLTLKIIKFLFY